MKLGRHIKQDKERDMTAKKKPVSKRVAGKKPAVKKQVKTVKDESYTELEMYCIWLNEYYSSLIKAGFKTDIALGLLMDKTSYPKWVSYREPTVEEITKYLDEDDDDLWDS
jgi:hypothetical protein